MSSHRPPSISDIVSGLGNHEEWKDYRRLLRSRESGLSKLLGAFVVEHAQINGERLKDPRFERYYYSHHGIQFLNEIESSYLRKLNARQISLDDFFEAMKSYVASRNSGSQGGQRRREAAHIVHHVLAKLVQNLRQGRQGTAKQSKMSDDHERRRRPVEGESDVERALRDLEKPDRREGS